MKKSKGLLRQILGNIVAILLIVIVTVLIIAFSSPTGRAIFFGSNCEEEDYKYIIRSEDIKRISNNAVEITCSITNVEEEPGYFKYGARLHQRETDDPKSRIVMNEIQSALNGEKLDPHVVNKKIIIIDSVPDIGTLWYGCFVEAPQKSVCYEKRGNRNIKVSVFS